MSKSGGILGTIFKTLFGSKIKGIENALDNDPRIKELTKKLDKSLEELEDAVDAYLESEMYD